MVPADASDAATEASPVDSGGCHPSSSAGLEKATYSPPKGGGYTGECSATEIDTYMACWSGTASACTSLADAGTTCRACIESRPRDATWGPVIIDTANTEVNEAGCGALNNNDTTTVGCGQGLADYTACLRFTCRDQCPGDAYVACANEARVTECKSIVQGLKTSCTADVSECFGRPGDTGDTLAKRVITRFCGSR